MAARHGAKTCNRRRDCALHCDAMALRIAQPPPQPTNAPLLREENSRPYGTVTVSVGGWDWFFGPATFMREMMIIIAFAGGNFARETEGLTRRRASKGAPSTSTDDIRLSFCTRRIVDTEVCMKKLTQRLTTLGVLSSLGIWLPGMGLAEPHVWHAPHTQLLDDRYHHGHYYPRMGAVVTELPAGYRTYWFHGASWYFAGGVWYQAGPGGFFVARPPTGLVVTLLPPFATTVWIAGVPYYYANDIYYRWDPAINGYEVVQPPAGADQPGVPPVAAATDLMIYPRNGQTPEQQAADRYECHSWSSNQTGFDPTRNQDRGAAPAPTLASKAEQYRRAMSACLEARGYSVK